MKKISFIFSLFLITLFFVYPKSALADGIQIIGFQDPASTIALQGTTYSTNGFFIDPDPNAASWAATVDYGDGSGVQQLTLNPDKTFTLSNIYNNVGDYHLLINISNDLGESGSGGATIHVPGAFNASNVSFDPASHIFTFTSDANWSKNCAHGLCGASGISIVDANNNPIAFNGKWTTNGACVGNDIPCQVVLSYDPGVLTTSQFYIRIVTFGGIFKGSNATFFDSQLLPSSVFQSNQAPSVGTITVTPNQPTINTSFTASASFTDTDTSDTHTAVWDWGDGTSNGTVTESNGSGSVSDSHTYTALGSYTVILTVTDNSGASNSAQTTVAVIPAGGLNGQNLQGSNYTGADLSNQNITNSNLKNSIFANVNFTNSDLTNANLKSANLTNANMTGANLTGANFKDAIMTGVIWSNTTCPNGTNSDNDGGTCIGQGGGL